MYLALYRKYRPKTFDDVISQEHITTTLKNQIAGGTAAHAYLFTGSRGTGKTTCAKILAMAVNCLAPRNGNPCFECENCRDIDNGTATDIIEMDAASNRGVDDVRRLRDEVVYTPVSCKYRVYIVDEVHMLTTEAFNALLKTLEEPPEHVKFILATTELHKVPATILSRCQRFEFRRIDISDSADRLMSVAQQENISLDRDAAELISRLSDGGMRDALSVLDRCASSDEHITSELVRNCAGVADNRYLFAFSEMIAAKDVSGCIKQLGELHQEAKDIARIIDELSGHYRDLMLFKAAPADTSLLSVAYTDVPEIERICGMYDMDNILRCLTLLQECADSIGKTRQRKTIAEMCLVKMCLGLGVHTSAPVVYPSAHTTSSPTMTVVEIPPEKFTPTPTTAMSKQNAANLAKLRALGQETAKVVQENAQLAQQNANTPSSAPQPVSEPVDMAPPEQNSAPAIPVEFDAPPPIEAPDEYVPPLEYTEVPPTESVSVAENKPADEVNSATVEDTTPKEDKPAEMPVLQSLTNEEWVYALNRTYPMTRSMLGDAYVKLDNGILKITSSNRMLENMAKTNDLSSLESELSDALGGRVRIEVITVAEDNDSSDQDSPVNKLLEKAKQLNIEVIYK